MLQLTTVRTNARDGITSEEEQRARSGYEVGVHYRFGDSEPTRLQATSQGDQPILELSFGQQASVWQINHGYRSKPSGFVLDSSNGRWHTNIGPVDTEEDGPLVEEIRPFVFGDHNIIVLRPLIGVSGKDDDSDNIWVTLREALRRGVETVFQVEERELTTHLVGDGDGRRILMVESAGGRCGGLGAYATDSALPPGDSRSAPNLSHGSGNRIGCERCMSGGVLSLPDELWQPARSRETRPQAGTRSVACPPQRRVAGCH